MLAEVNAAGMCDMAIGLFAGMAMNFDKQTLQTELSNLDQNVQAAELTSMWGEEQVERYKAACKEVLEQLLFNTDPIAGAISSLKRQGIAV